MKVLGCVHLLLIVFVSLPSWRKCIADAEEGVCRHGSNEDGECIHPHNPDENVDIEEGHDEEGSEEEDGSGEEEVPEEGGHPEEEEACFDEADDCQERALNDGCILDFVTMSQECAMTCFLCYHEYNLVRVPNMYSLVPQLLLDDEALAEYVSRVDEYVYESVFSREDVPDNVKLNCKNKDPQCSFWARGGECGLNKEFMLDRCAASCMDCENGLSYSVRCPFDPKDAVIWQAGDLHQMFTHLVTSPEHFDYAPEILSRPISNPNPKFDEKDGPWVVVLDEFLPQEECEALLQLSEEGEFKAVEGGNEETEVERSHAVRKCMDECADSEIVEHVEGLLQYMTGVPTEHIEPFEFVKFAEGDFHGLHSDYQPHEFSLAQGPRILTMIIFLSDVPPPEEEDEEDEDGDNDNGGIYFEEIDSIIHPQRGRAVIFPNVLDKHPMARDRRTQYEMVSVREGSLSAVNIWLHQRDYKSPLANDCTA